MSEISKEARDEIAVLLREAAGHAEKDDMIGAGKKVGEALRMTLKEVSRVYGPLARVMIKSQIKEIIE